MRVQRFQAADMQTALDTVSARMGPDAVIISTRGLGSTVAERRRGLEGVEIIAGVDVAASDPRRAELPAPAAIGGAAAAVARNAYARGSAADQPARPLSRGGIAQPLIPSTPAAVNGLDSPAFRTVDRFGEPMLDGQPADDSFAALLARAGGRATPDLCPASEAPTARDMQPVWPAVPHSADRAADTDTSRQLRSPVRNGQPDRRETAATTTRASAAAERAYEVLLAAGLTADVAGAALEKAIGLMPAVALADVERLIEVALSRLIAGLPAGPGLAAASLYGKTLLFVGAAGAGKTTALLKAAVTLRSAGADVSIIGADVSHLGAREQLVRYAGVLRLPIQVAYSPAELSRLLASMPDRQIALVDTPACLPGDRWESDTGVVRTRAVVNGRSSSATLSEHSEELLALLRATPDSVVVLTAAAGTSEAMIDRLALIARATGATVAAITKLDEIVSAAASASSENVERQGAGAALNLLARLRLSPLLCSSGRDVLTGLATPSAAELAVATLEQAIAGH